MYHQDAALSATVGITDETIDRQTGLLRRHAMQVEMSFVRELPSAQSPNDSRVETDDAAFDVFGGIREIELGVAGD